MTHLRPANVIVYRPRFQFGQWYAWVTNGPVADHLPLWKQLIHWTPVTEQEALEWIASWS